MTKLVIGYDGGDGGRDALALALALADAKAELVVGVVLPYEPVPVLDPEGYDRALAEHFEELFAAAEAALAGHPFERCALRDGSPARALGELAEAEDASMIVLGSTHRGKLGRVYPGSVGERLLNGGPCALAVAPRGFADREQSGLRTIGVAYDGTAESKLALAEGARLRGQLGAQLSLIAVVPGPEEMAARMSRVAPGLESAARELILTVGYGEGLRQHYIEVLDAGASELRDAAVETVLDDGDPAAALAARGVELDLLVIGSRGYGPLRRVLLGGVSAEVMRTAPCPVIVVPRAASGDGGEAT